MLKIQPYNTITLAFFAVIGALLLTACKHNNIRLNTTQPTALKSSTHIMPDSYVEELLNAEFILQREGPNKAFEPFYELASKVKSTDILERLVNVAIATKNDFYVEKSTNLWLATDSKNASAYALKFQVLAKNQRTKDISTLFIEAKKNNVSLHFLPVFLEDNADKNEQVESIADAILQLPATVKNDQNVQLSHAHILFLSGQYQAAINISKRLLTKESMSKNKVLYLILAFSQKKLGNLNEAISTLTIASKDFPNSARIIAPFIGYLVEKKQIQQAIAVYTQTDLAPSNKLQLSVNFMQTLLKHKYPQQVLVISNMTLPEINNPETNNGISNQIRYLTAIALSQLNQKEKAINTMKQVGGNLRIDATQKIAIWLYDIHKENNINNMVLSRTRRENMPEQVALISRLHEEHNNVALSYDLLSRTCKTLPESDILCYKKALLADTLGDWKTTEIELKKLLLKAPKNPQYLNALGYTLLTRTNRIDEAMMYIEAAYERKDDDPAIIDSLGWGYFLKGELEQSSYYLKKAWDILPDAEIAAHYGESLWKQHYYMEAMKIWKTALSTAPNTSLLLDTIKRLSPYLLEVEQ